MVRQIAVGAKLSLPSDGHRYSMMRFGSYVSAYGMANEQIGGVAFIQWLNAVSEGGDEAIRSLLETMEGLLRRIVMKTRLTVSCSETVGDEAIDALIDAFPTGGSMPKEATFAAAGARREGIVIPAQISFAVKGGNLDRFGLSYSGSIPVLANVLNFTYLWNLIRVQGGAYGCGFVGRDTGELCFYTYRDPKPARSLGVMREAASFIRGFVKENPDLTGFILSAVSSVDPLRTADVKIAAGDNRWFRGITEEQIAERYRKLIGTTPKDLLDLCGMLEKIAEEPSVCVTGGKDLLDACGDEITDRIVV